MNTLQLVLLLIALLLIFLLSRRTQRSTVGNKFGLQKITPASGEQLFSSSAGISISQGYHSINIIPSSIIYVTQSVETARMTYTGLGIGTSYTNNNLLQVDKLGLAGISLGDLTSTTPRYIGITGRLGVTPGTTNSEFHGIIWGNPTSDGYLSFCTRNINLSGERVRVTSYGSFLVGTQTAATNSRLVINGALSEQYPMSITLYGTPTLTNFITSGIFSGSTYMTANNPFPYQYCSFPSVGSGSVNWNPILTSSIAGLPKTAISIPYSGLYSLRFTYETTTKASTEIFISKNMAYPTTNYNTSYNYQTLPPIRYLVISNPSSPIMCWSELRLYGTSDSNKLTVSNLNSVFQTGLVTTNDLPYQLFDVNDYSFVYVNQASPTIVVDLNAVTAFSKLVLVTTSNPNDPPLGNYNVGTTVYGYGQSSSFYAPGEWFQYNLSTTITPTGYSLCFTNLSPVNFSLLGSSNGGSSWTMLDTQKNISFPAKTLMTYSISTASSFNAFRLVITQLGSGTGFQLCSFVMKNSSGFVPNSTLTTNPQTVNGVQYTLTTSIPTSSIYSTSVTSNILGGEWFQQTTSSGFVLTSYSISTTSGVNLSKIAIVASNDGRTWTQLTSIGGQSVSLTPVNTMITTYTVSNQTAYTSYRLIVLQLTTSTTLCNIGSWVLYSNGTRFPATPLNPTASFPQTVNGVQYTLSSSTPFPIGGVTPTITSMYSYPYPNVLAILSQGYAVSPVNQLPYLLTLPFVLYTGTNGVYTGATQTMLSITPPVTPLFVMTQTSGFSNYLSCFSLPYQIIASYSKIPPSTFTVPSGSFFYNGSTITSSSPVFTSLPFPDQTGATTFTKFNKTKLTAYPNYTLLLGTIANTNLSPTFGDLAPDNESMPNDNLLASATLPIQTNSTTSATISTTTMLQAGDYVSFGTFTTNTTATGSPTPRCQATVTLLQRTQ